MTASKSNIENSFFSGWSLTGIISILLMINVIITFLVNDINDKETVSILIRSTAKLSFLLFMSAFVASSLHHYVKGAITKWLLKNRRYIGVSFAVSHYLHLAALILMTLHIDFNVFEDRGLFKTTFGGVAYAFMTLMAITSFDRTRNLFGAKNWKRIHTVGGYLLWIIFAQSYILDMSSPLRIFFTIVAVSVFVLRISVLFIRKG